MCVVVHMYMDMDAHCMLIILMYMCTHVGGWETLWGIQCSVGVYDYFAIFDESLPPNKQLWSLSLRHKCIRLDVGPSSQNRYNLYSKRKRKIGYIVITSCLSGWYQTAVSHQKPFWCESAVRGQPDKLITYNIELENTYHNCFMNSYH